MALGQLTYLQLTNATLRRLGKAQVVSADFAGLAADTWGGLVKDFLNDAQREVYKEHDWSTLITLYTISAISDRTYNLSTSVSDFGREIDLTSTTNDQVLEPTTLRTIDTLDPDLDDSASPLRYHIAYPNLLFDRTPSSETFRLRYVKRPAVLSAVTAVSDLPEYCDMVLVWYAYWQLQATREDATDGGEVARSIYENTLARAIGQDRRRMDRVWSLQPIWPTRIREVVPFPPAYDTDR